MSVSKKKKVKEKKDVLPFGRGAEFVKQMINCGMTLKEIQNVNESKGGILARRMIGTLRGKEHLQNLPLIPKFAEEQLEVFFHHFFGFSVNFSKIGQKNLKNKQVSIDDLHSIVGVYLNGQERRVIEVFSLFVDINSVDYLEGYNKWAKKMFLDLDVRLEFCSLNVWEQQLMGEYFEEIENVESLECVLTTALFNFWTKDDPLFDCDERGGMLFAYSESRNNSASVFLKNDDGYCLWLDHCLCE